MVLRAYHFLGIGAVVMYFVVAAVVWMVKPTPAVGDSQAKRDAIALVASHIGQAVEYYDLEWNDEPRVVSADTVNGNSVVMLMIRFSTVEPYSEGTTRHEVLVRGVISPKNALLGKIRVVHEREIGKPAAA